MPNNPPQRKKVVIDTSCYIPYLNFPVSQGLHPLTRLIFENTEYLSTVVFAELRAGAHQATDIKRLGSLKRLFQARSRFLIPTLTDWERTGEVLTRLGERFHMEGKGLARLFNDTLIAISARRIGAVVVTNNRIDFERIRACCSFELYIWE